MLTDYHVHLRPDARDTPAARYFTPGNAERYREVATERGVTELGVSEHVHRFSAALDVWQHPFWRANAVDELDAYVAFVREETDLKLGIEADYINGREDRMANLLEAHEWDYVLGSGHFLGDHAGHWDDGRGDGGVDGDGERVDVWRFENSAERIWRRYFEAVAESAVCGLFDIISHPDL